MRYTKKQFLDDVSKEAKKLKKLATPEEKDNLNFSRFNPNGRSNCIYGQMTGDCRNNRAIELIGKCCIRYVKNPWQLEEINNFTGLKKNINGTKNETPRSLTYFSLIEAYIFMNLAKRENLIAYLKGERKDLVL